MATPAVLIVAFNRPAATREVFLAVRAARPAKLFFACDGPRAHKAGEAALVAEVRALVSGVDWPCEVQVRFPEANLGCAVGVSSAIAWFLTEAGEGIILEDDCLPTPAFFRFCAAMLEKYRDDPRIGLVTGSKMVPAVDFGASFGFSRFFACWGWATWRRAWEGYQLHPAPVAPAEAWRRHLHRQTSLHLARFITKQLAGAAHTWDYQGTLHMLRQDMLTVVPNRNLVLNIGFDGQGTHFTGTSAPWWAPRRSFDVADAWTETPWVAPSAEYDRCFQAGDLRGGSRLFRTWLKWQRRARAFFRPEES